MKLKHTSLVLAAALATVIAAGAASAASTSSGASVVIRHQMRGCHTWSVNSGPFKASQSITLKRGSWLTVTNNDVMPHKLELKSGPVLRIAPATLGHMGALVKVTFARSGVYHFVTKAGEDYPAMAGMKTIGEDNLLRLTVTVT
jgi:plastocyanin